MAALRGSASGTTDRTANFTEVRMKKVLLFVILSVPSFYFVSCGNTEKPAEGLEDEIYVVADSTEFNSLSSELDSVFEKIIYTPQSEKLFTLIRIDPNQLDKYKTKKNILIVAPLNSGSTTSRFIQASIDSSGKNKYGNNFLIRKENLWAAGQLVMILTAPTIQELKLNILKDKDNLLYSYQKVSDERLKSCIYNPRYENVKLEGRFLKEHGWVIYIQKNYKLALDTPTDNFVWLKRSSGSDMECWLFVKWINNASPLYLNEDSVKAVRNRMTEKYYRTGDSANVNIAADNYMSSEVMFNGRYAIFTQGLWELNTKRMGGPFINYTFFDEETKRLYMLDGSVFAPKYYKRNLIQQMDVLLQSFMTNGQLNNNKRESLLSAAKN